MSSAAAVEAFIAPNYPVNVQNNQAVGSKKNTLINVLWHGGSFGMYNTNLSDHTENS